VLLENKPGRREYEKSHYGLCKNHLVGLHTEGKDVIGLFISETWGANKGVLNNTVAQKK